MDRTIVKITKNNSGLRALWGIFSTECHGRRCRPPCRALIGQTQSFVLRLAQSQMLVNWPLRGTRFEISDNNSVEFNVLIGVRKQTKGVYMNQYICIYLIIKC